MSHQRYPSHDVREPHSVSLKVLRLSRPSLVAQYPVQPPFSPPASHLAPLSASLAYHTPSDQAINTNPSPFIITPILNLPPSFGSAYVGETFSCTLCVNHDVPPSPSGTVAAPDKTIRDVRIDAEMKTPSSPTSIKLSLLPPVAANPSHHPSPELGTGTEVDREPPFIQRQQQHQQEDKLDLLPPGSSHQRILSFDLKEEGSHVLAVTVSYYEAGPLSGRTRTFRKLYQFMCKPSLIVRTKPGALAPRSKSNRKRWVLEAQLENCSEETLLLERVGMVLEKGLKGDGCNFWEEEEQGDEYVGGEAGDEGQRGTQRELGLRSSKKNRPVLQPGETEQVCFVIEEETAGVVEEVDERVVFGIMQIGWRSEMGNRGFLSTGRLGTRTLRPRERAVQA